MHGKTSLKHAGINVMQMDGDRAIEYNARLLKLMRAKLKKLNSKNGRTGLSVLLLI